MTEGVSSSPSARRIYSLLCLMVTLWALNFIIARYAVREIPPVVVASMRAVLAGLILLPFWWLRARATGEAAFARGDWLRLTVLSATGVSLNQLCFLVGIGSTSTSHAAVLIGLTPLFVLALAAMAGLETLTARKMLGMLIAMAGVAVLQFARGSSGNATLAGDLMIAGAALTFAVYTILGKKLTARISGLALTAFSYLIGGMLLLPLALWQARNLDFSQISGTAWTAMAYMTLFPSALCYVIFYYALKHVPASRVSNVGYLQPVLAMGLGIWLLGDSLTSELLAGGSLVLTGVVLSERG